MQLERKSKLTPEEFQKGYLEANKPVIVTDAMNNWDAIQCWTPNYFEEHFGCERVQLYDNLFNLVDIIS